MVTAQSAATPPPQPRCENNLGIPRNGLKFVVGSGVLKRQTEVCGETGWLDEKAKAGQEPDLREARRGESKHRTATQGEGGEAALRGQEPSQALADLLSCSIEFSHDHVYPQQLPGASAKAQCPAHLLRPYLSLTPPMHPNLTMGRPLTHWSVLTLILQTKTVNQGSDTWLRSDS